MCGCGYVGVWMCGCVDVLVDVGESTSRKDVGGVRVLGHRMYIN